MTQRVDRAGLQVAAQLADFIEGDALPGTGIAADAFWTGFSALIHDFGPKNKALLEKRETIQSQIDDWHKERGDQAHDYTAYEAFLRDIGYVVPQGDDFTIDTANVDPEIASIAGPQLVVPITNARFALNAANARWGSLYDAFYGTDAMGRSPQDKGYDRGHGSRVVARTRVFLDDTFPITGASHGDVRRYVVERGALMIDDAPLMIPARCLLMCGWKALCLRSWIAKIPWPVWMQKTRCWPTATGLA